MNYDLVVHGGRVFDPGSGRFLRLDVGIRGRRVAALAPEIPPSQARWRVDAIGFVVSPGLVDLHIHAYWGATFWGIHADEVCPRGGVTTAVDAGSAGAYNYPGFDRYVVRSNRTRTLAFINISTMGLVNPFYELVHPAFADAMRTVETAQRHPEGVVGVKIRVGDNIVGDHFRWAMAEAREAADILRQPLMVHIGTSPPTLAEILPFLRPGTSSPIAAPPGPIGWWTMAGGCGTTCAASWTKGCAWTWATGRAAFPCPWLGPSWSRASPGSASAPTCTPSRCRVRSTT